MKENRQLMLIITNYEEDGEEIGIEVTKEITEAKVLEVDEDVDYR